MAMFNPAHPGEILRELYLDGLGLSSTEAAKGLGVSAIVSTVAKVRSKGYTTLQVVAERHTLNIFE